MRMRRNKGFTMAEIMVVLVMMGIMVAFVQLNIFSLLGRSRFKASVQDLMDVFRMAIKASTESNRRYEIEIDLDQQIYRLREINSGNIDDVSDEEIILEMELPEECHIDSVVYDSGEYYGQGHRVKFHIGHAGWFRGAAIYLSDHDGNQYSILINRLNRMVELFDGEIELLSHKDETDMAF